MTIWSSELKELEKVHPSIRKNHPQLNKELTRLLKTDDENIVLVYARRCLEIIITDLCECELGRSRGSEPLKRILDKLNREEIVPAHIIGSMNHINSISTFGAHPKEYDPEQVKPVLLDLATTLRWYLRYRGQEEPVTTTGDYEGKEGPCEEAMPEFIRYDMKREIGRTRHGHAHYALLRKDYSESLRRYQIALKAITEAKDYGQAFFELDGIAMSLAGKGLYKEGLMLHGVVLFIYKQYGIFEDETEWPDFWRHRINETIRKAKQEVGDELARQYEEEGIAMGFEKALDYALKLKSDEREKEIQ